MFAILFGLVLVWAIAVSFWAFFLFKKTKSDISYYETAEWFNGKQGVHYSAIDDKMDSLVYLHDKNQVCWFHGRVLADVEKNGTFLLKFANGGRLSGCVHQGDSKIELVGLPGTSEDGISETMLLHN